MKCPNCGKEMKDIYHDMVSLGDEPDYDSVCHYCSECKNVIDQIVEKYCK